MKNRNFIKTSIVSLLPIAMAVGALLGVNKKTPTEAHAYTGASLPTTIKLNDPSESTIRNYYSDLNSLSDTERKGNNLLKNLKTILSDGQKYYNYDSGDLVWKMYEITDRDWDKSPASSTTYGSYNATTNTLSNYQYGSNSSPKNNPFVRAYYMDRSQDNVVKAWGNHDQNGTGINREHLWAKAEGFDGSGAAGARGDPMHLVAANGYANNIHSNHFYGYVDKTKSYEDVKNKYSTLGHNYSGFSKTYPSSGVTVFEPQDCDKGDIARAIFYMAARYNNIAGKTASQEEFDADNPNLLLTNDLSKWKSSGYTSTATSPGYHGLVSDLLEWNRIDKPDAYEIHRNNLLFTNFTNNRNPFIDFPEWADYIWGDQSASASPSTDVLNGGGGSQTVTVTSIEITKKPNKLIYTAGESLDLTGMVVKANKSDGTSQILNNSEYSVTPNGALKVSDKVVTISYSEKSASFNIAVQGGGSGGDVKELTFDLTTNPGSWPTVNSTTLTNYTYTLDGTSYSFGLKNVKVNSGYLMLTQPAALGLPAIEDYKLTKVEAKNSSGCSTAVNVGISSSYSSEDYISGGEKITWDKTSSTYTYSLDETDVNTPYYLYVTSKNAQIVSISLTYESSKSSNVSVTGISLNPPSKTAEIGENFSITPTISPSDATVQLVSWNSSNQSVAMVNEDGMVTAVSAGTTTITCSALDGSGVTATCAITVNEPVTLQSLSLSGEYATEFYLGDEFSNTGMIVTAHFSDGTTQDVSDESLCSGFDSETTGTKTIIVSYDGVSTTYTVTVKETRLDDNQRLFVASKQGTGSGEVLTSYTDNPITLSFDKSSGSVTPKYYSNTTSFRVYGGNTFTLVSSKKITKIEFEMASTDYVGSNPLSTTIGNFSNNVWTGETNTITFSVGGTSGQRNIVSIKVTYDENSQEIATLSSISLGGTYKTEFFRNEEFTYSGLVVTAHYSDETSEVVTPTSVSTPTMSTTGAKTVTVSYTEGDITKSATYNIQVIAVVATSIELTGNYKTEFIQGDKFSYSGMTVVEHFNNGTTQNHLAFLCAFTGYDMDTVGEQTVTVTYGSNSATYQINVLSNGKIVEQKSVSLNIGTYAEANNWEDAKQYSTINANNDITIVALKTAGTGTGNTGKYYANGNNWRLYQSEAPELTISAPNNGKIKTVTITYTVSSTGILTLNESNVASDEEVTINSKTCIFSVGNTGSALNGQVRISNIEVTYELTTDPIVKTVESISVDGNYKSSFNVGDEFSFGGTVTATYSDETTEDVTSDATFSGYDMSTAGSQTVTVTYSEKTTTYNINVLSLTSNTYTQSGGKFLDGKYLIGFPTKETNEYRVMKAEIASNRFSFEKVQKATNGVTTSNELLEWTISKNGDYYTIYNEKTAKYAASTGTKNQGALQDNINDKALWSLSYSENQDTYSFINKYNSNLQTPVNSSLQNNEDYGFATYSYSASSALSLFRLDATSFVKVTNSEQLTNGSKLTLTGVRNGVNTTFGLGNINNNSKIIATELDWNSTGIYGYQNEEVNCFEVVSVGENFALKTADGKYLYSDSTSTNIYLSSQCSDAQLFTTEVKNGVISIKCLGNNRYLGFNYNSGNTPYFGFYKETSYSPYTNIYVDRNSGEANAWSAEFLKGTQGCTITNWDNYGSSYRDMSFASKTAIKEAVSNQDGSLVEQAAARYDYIVADPRYGVSAFITDRAVAPANRNVIALINIKDNPTMFIILFALAGLTTIGAYIYVKRRKEADI